jgi:gluconokinase
VKARRWVVMGVAGSGKSTLAALLAQHLGCAFIEGDDLHPSANIVKMRAGQPLGDEDRLPWLLQLQAHIAAARHEDRAMVLTCSALKRRYRGLLREGDPGLLFLHLDGLPSLFEQRLQERTQHFMPASLLASQLRDLEPLSPDEAGMRLDAANTAQQLIGQLLRHFAAENF